MHSVSPDLLDCCSFRIAIQSRSLEFCIEIEELLGNIMNFVVKMMDFVLKMLGIVVESGPRAAR